MSAVVEFQENKSLVQRMANRFGVDANKMLSTLKATAFKGDVSNEQMMALLVVAEQHGLNPWTKEIYAFPSQQGIVPVVGVDGWARIINEHPQFDGMDFNEADDGAWIECVIHRKDREHPTKVREWMAECARGTAPWKSHPRRMLRHKALIQCARIAFGFGGIYDQDEAERIVEAEPELIQVTGTRVDPRGDTSMVSDLDEMKHVAAIKDILGQIEQPDNTKDEITIAEELRQYEADFLQPFPERYIRVQDALAKQKIISKSDWKKYLKVGLDRGETHTS
jgi:phage recombination protein Bet